MFGKNDTVTAVKNTLRKRSGDKFFMKFVTHIPGSKRHCSLCLGNHPGNHIGDEKRYILHCTDINFIEPRKSFIRELYRINTNSYLINSSPKDITQWILSCRKID